MEGDGRLFNGRQRMNKIQLLIQLNTLSLDARLLGKRERVVVFDTIMVLFRNIGLAVLVLALQDMRNVPATLVSGHKREAPLKINNFTAIFSPNT